MTVTRDIGLPEPDGPATGPTSPSALAGRGPYRPDAHAVIIGIDRYRDPSIPDLRCARADAVAVHRVLTDPAIGRFDPANVTLLVDEQATEFGIRSAIGTRLPKRVAPGHTVVVYYAGHGAPMIDPASGSADGLEKYLVPHDAHGNDLRASAIAMETVERWFGWLNGRQVIFLLDSCYSGSAGGRSFEYGGAQTRAFGMTDEFLAKLSRTEARLVVTACAPNEVSLEDASCGHGLFTYHLVKGLEGAADADRDGFVTVDELYEYVYTSVERDARTRGGEHEPAA